MKRAFWELTFHHRYDGKEKRHHYEGRAGFGCLAVAVLGVLTWALIAFFFVRLLAGGRP